MRQCAFGSGHMRHESVSCAFSLPCVFVMFLWHVPLARVFGMSLCHGTHGAIFRHLDYGELARFRQITFSHKVASMTMYPFLVKEIYAAGQGDFFLTPRIYKAPLYYEAHSLAISAEAIYAVL